MDDAGPGDSADPRQPAGAVMEQGVDKGAVEIAGGGMDDHSRRLLDHEQMIVLEEDLERDVLGRVMGRLRRRNGDRIETARNRLRRGIADRAALRADHLAAADERLEPFARQGGDRDRERTIEPPAFRVLGDPSVQDRFSPHHRIGEIVTGAQLFKSRSALETLNRNRQ